MGSEIAGKESKRNAEVYFHYAKDVCVSKYKYQSFPRKKTSQEQTQALA